jgi:hypothetical protein
MVHSTHETGFKKKFLVLVTMFFLAATAAADVYDRTVLSDRPVLFLPMDAPASGAQADLSGNGLDGTYQGGTPAPVPMPNGATAAGFNGAGQYLTVRHSPKISVPTTGVLTVEAWIRPDVLEFPDTEETQYVYFLGKGNPTDGYEYANRMYSRTNAEDRPNRISFYHWNPEGDLGSGSYFQDTVAANQWIMVTSIVNMNTGMVDIYKNGVLRDSTPLSQYSVVPRMTNAPFNVGTRNYNSWFKGAIGKVAIYDYALSTSRMAKHYVAMMAAPSVTTSGPDPDMDPPSVLSDSSARSDRKFLSPAPQDGVNDSALFGPAAQEVTILDAEGNRFFHGLRSAGDPVLSWNCADLSGRPAPSGVYIAEIMTNDSRRIYQNLVVVK